MTPLIKLKPSGVIWINSDCMKMYFRPFEGHAFVVYWAGDNRFITISPTHVSAYERFKPDGEVNYGLRFVIHKRRKHASQINVKPLFRIFSIQEPIEGVYLPQWDAQYRRIILNLNQKVQEVAR